MKLLRLQTSAGDVYLNPASISSIVPQSSGVLVIRTLNHDEAFMITAPSLEAILAQYEEASIPPTPADIKAVENLTNLAAKFGGTGQ